MEEGLKQREGGESAKPGFVHCREAPERTVSHGNMSAAFLAWLAEGTAMTASHGLHSSSQASWGPQQLQALTGLLYIIHGGQQRATPRAAGEQHLLLTTPLPWCSCCISFSLCSLPRDSRPWDSFSAAAKWALRLHFEGRTLGSSYLCYKSQCHTGSSPWGRHPDHQISLFFHSLTGPLFLLWKYAFWRMNLQHWEPLQFDTRWAQTSNSDSTDINI